MQVEATRQVVTLKDGESLVVRVPVAYKSGEYTIESFTTIDIAAPPHWPMTVGKMAVVGNSRMAVEYEINPNGLRLLRSTGDE